jgi:DNA end-binding protein Ku
MAPRSMFKGYLRLSLVSVPVKAVTANVSSAEIRLNQLHGECNSRIKYLKSCPTHGEVSNDEIVSGYEYAKDQYVIIDTAEISKIRKKSEKTIDITGFISASQLEPIYFSGKTYYLLPDGPAGNKPYQLMRDAMVEEGLYAIGTAILSGREQMVCIRPIENLIGMSVLTYHEKVKQASEFKDEVKAATVTKEEMALTKTLIDASRVKDFDISSYKDGYVAEMTELIEMKVEGKEIVSVADPEEPKVINLMEALKASVENARRGVTAPAAAGAADDKKVKARMAPSASERAPARKRKSG